MSWQCITLTTKDKDIDLVIQSESCMDKLLKFLISRLNSINGIRDSAKPVKEVINQQRVKQLKLSCSMRSSPEFTQEINHFMMCRVMLTYTIMRARAKIGFRSMRRAQTLTHLVLSAVLKTQLAFNPFMKDDLSQVAHLFKKDQSVAYNEILELLE